MTFENGVQGFNRFLSLVFLIFLKNLLQTYWYPSMGVAEWNPYYIGLFMALFSAVDWVLFWYFFQDLFLDIKKVVILLATTIVFTSIPYFLFSPVISLDHENLLIKSVCYFIPFALFLIFKKSPDQIFLPIVMAFIPLVNLEIANGLTGNPSFLNFLFKSEAFILPINDHLYLDFGLIIIKTFFWSAIVILFYEINHQFFTYKSWRLFVELPLDKGYLFSVFLIFKMLIYWFLLSLIAALMGNYSLPLFTNKVGLFLNLMGYLGMITLCTLYFRKYITLYFYDKIGHSNWIYPLFFIPVLDFLALIITLILPSMMVKRIFNYKTSKKLFVRLVVISLLGYAVFAGVTDIINIPQTQSGVRNSLILAQIVLPVLSAIGIVLAQRSRFYYRLLLSVLLLMLPVFYFYILSPEVINSLKIEELVHIVSVYLNIGLLVAFLYPVLNLKAFLKVE